MSIDTITSPNPPGQEIKPPVLKLVTAIEQSKAAQAGFSPRLLKYDCNDHGNAQRLVALHGEDLRFCHAMKKWLQWDGSRWAIDDTGQAWQLARLTMVEYLRQCVGAGDRESEKFAHKSCNAKNISALLKMAEGEIFIRPADLDTGPYLLNFKNGTVDLRTGALRPHHPGDFITKLVYHDYKPGARCPQWLAFLDAIMGRNRPLIAYLQRALGYSLTGCTIEKTVFVLFGSGDNGKTTMLSTFRRLFGEYTTLLQVDTLMVRQESNNSQADLADLRGARFVQTSESESGQRLAQGKLKRITQGMGPIKAVRKYENPIEFPETHKLWMDTNRRPEITDADDQATFNRLHPIPFLVTIPKDEIDRDLPAKLLSEAEGVLAWAVQGAKLWYKHGLGKPPAIEAATEQWRVESDLLERFIADRSKPGGHVFGEEFYDAYREWVAANGHKRYLSAKEFGDKMKQRAGVTKKHTNKGARYDGIQLRPARAGSKAGFSKDDLRR